MKAVGLALLTIFLSQPYPFELVVIITQEELTV